VFIPLSKAVARAHTRLFPDEPRADPKTLQAIALALTELIPIYWRDPGTGARYQLTELELAEERFEGRVMEALIVSPSRFERALETLQIASVLSAPRWASRPASPPKTAAD
jgi:hypothetical protein